MKTILFYSCLTVFVALTSVHTFSQDLQPTGEEQYMLELINRARMNPAEEGVRLANHPDANIQGAINFFGIDRNAMIADFANYPARPPLSMNMLLIEAARRHSTDLRDNNLQSHTGTDGSTLGSRVTDSGYQWRALAENVFSYGRNLDYSHAGFVVDWGVPSLGHRNNTLEFEGPQVYTEIGIGIVSTESGNSGTSSVKTSAIGLFEAPGVEPFQSSDVGPLVVTIDFAASFDDSPILLGVVYEDNDNDDFYSVGEGKGAVTVTVLETGDSTLTYNSGGYSIPVSALGTYTVEISGDGIATEQKTVEITGDNVKVDFQVTEAVHVQQWMMY